MFSPLILNVDKAIEAWNTIFEDDMLMADNADEMQALASAPAGRMSEMNRMQIISGASYGSSFVGMVHTLKDTNSMSDQSLFSLANSLQTQFDVSCWLSRMQGGVGGDSQMSQNAKSLLSNQRISSHISLVTMGIIPALQPSIQKLAVKELANFDPAETMSQLQTLATATKDGMHSNAKKTVHGEAEKARTGKKVHALQKNKIHSVVSALKEVNDGSNQILDISKSHTPKHLIHLNRWNRHPPSIPLIP